MALISDDPTPPGTEAIESIDEIEFLRRGILLGEGFQLYLVEAESLDARQRVIDELCAMPGVAAAVVTGDSLAGKTIAEVIAGAFASVEGRVGRPVVIVTAIDELIAGNPTLLARLNEQRSQLIAGSTGAVVVLATPRVIGGVRRFAPDTWSVRAADLSIAGAASAPATPDGVLRWQPIRHPRPGELWEAEAALAKAAAGNETGRLALRLAEIYESERASNRSIASLYLQAAENVTDRSLATLARVNASRTLARMGDNAAAARSIDLALEQAGDLDSGMQAYAWLSRSVICSAANDTEGAVRAADQAILAAERSQDGDMIAEVRLERATVQRRLSRLEKAMTEAKMAEAEAVKVGNTGLAQQVRILLGAIAVEAGLPRLAEGSWARYLDAGRGAQGNGYSSLVAQVAKLDDSTTVNAAREGWSILVNLAERSGDQADLAGAVVWYLLPRVLWEGTPIDQSLWERRLADLVPAHELHQATFEFLKVRAALNTSADGALDGSWGTVFERLESLASDDFLKVIVRLNRVALFALSGQIASARHELTGMLQFAGTRRVVFQYLAEHARRGSGGAEMAPPEWWILALVLEWLGGTEAVRDLGVFLTGGEAPQAVTVLLEKIERQATSMIPEAGYYPEAYINSGGRQLDRCL